MSWLCEVRRLGRGHIGSIEMRLGPRDVGSTRDKPALTRAGMCGNQLHGARDGNRSRGRAGAGLSL
jgi:hypothetical protein